MTIGKGRRPNDPNQVAKWVVDQTAEPQPQTISQAKLPGNISEYMAKIGKKGGEIGGKRRLKTMTREQRSKIAAKAAKTRWKKAKKSTS